MNFGRVHNRDLAKLDSHPGFFNNQSDILGKLVFEIRDFPICFYSIPLLTYHPVHIKDNPLKVGL